MASLNYLMQWEGDSTQALDSFTWQSREVIFPKRVRLCCGRVIFETGDLDDYWDEVETRAKIIKRNAQKIAAMDVGIGYQGGGWPVGSLPLAGIDLETVSAEPSYSGDLALTIYIYADGTQVASKSLYTTGIFKFDPGVKARQWSYKIVGNVDSVKRVDLASSVRELQLMAGREAEV